MYREARLDDAGVDAARVREPAAPSRVLIIDVDKVHRMLMCRAADRAGYVPAGAATYEEAAKLAQKSAFDCVTLDLSLGRHASAEMLRHLHMIDCRATILVVGAADSADCAEVARIARSLGLNVGDPVPKPVDVGMLRFTLEQMKVHRSLQRALAAVGV
jgi:two-component system, chemotaxis family, chemotaxis protein CheY